MENLEKAMGMYVAYLRAIYFIHQNNHWTTEGSSFYQDHLLFERIYLSAQENADAAAEKVKALFGKESLQCQTQAGLLTHLVSKYQKDSLLENSLDIEKDFIEFSSKVYRACEKAGKLTLGLDDLIMSIASKREESVYLLSSALA